jgi:tetratricopeptide (TPR) repeat protein
MADLLDRAVAIDPGFVDAIALRASVAMLSADYNEPVGGSSAAARDLARQLATQALALQPVHGLALGVLTNLDQGDHIERTGARRSVGEIMQGFDAALAADPRNADLLNWRGRWLSYIGRLTDAEADFRNCREVDPAYAPCGVNWAGVLTLLGRRQEARQALIDAAAGGALIAGPPLLLTLHALDMREEFYIVGGMMPRLRGWYDFAAIYEALGDPDADHSVLRSRLSALWQSGDEVANRWAGERTLMAALGDQQTALASYLEWLPTQAHYRRSAAFRTSVIDGGRLRYWQEHGFPPQCRAVGADDFVCD